MTEQGAKLMENFSEYVNSPEYGGPIDRFSTKKLFEVKQRSETLNTTKKVELIDKELKKSEELQKELQEEIAKIRDKDGKQNIDGIPFKNRFPYGECNYETTPPKLESILQTSALDMKESSMEFSRLCKTLFPDTYGDIGEESRILMDVF